MESLLEILSENRDWLLLTSGIFGALFGSFATALIYRLPREINWVSKRSECTSCNHNLGFLDLFPILSYLLTKGNCRYCKQSYSGGYLGIEILMIFTFILSAYLFGPTFKMLIISLLAFATIVLCAIDFEHYIIPDELNIFIFILGISYGIYNNASLNQLLLMPLFYFGLAFALRWLMFVWKKKEGLGFGDVKFFGAAGAFLNIEALSLFLMLSGLIGVLIAISWKILKKGEAFPFGPAISISLLLCVAFPEYIQKYIQLSQQIMN